MDLKKKPVSTGSRTMTLSVYFVVYFFDDGILKDQVNLDFLVFAKVKCYKHIIACFPLRRAGIVPEPDLDTALYKHSRTIISMHFHNNNSDVMESFPVITLWGI